jgi:D-alanyl-D-alanine carboxypeptidase
MNFTEILKKMQQVHDAKNHDYSPQGEFGNFQESEKIGIPGWKGAFVRLQDKYTRACNLIAGKEPKVIDEALDDTLLDLANYAVIVLALKGKTNVKTVSPGAPYLPGQTVKIVEK